MKDKYYIFSLPLLVALKGMNAIAMHINPPITEATIRVGLRPHLKNIKNYIIHLNLLLYLVEVN